MARRSGGAGERHERARNFLLELLPAAEKGRLRLKMELISVERGAQVFAQHQPIGFVHFPLSAMVSVVKTMRDGQTIEVGTIGNEGFAGLPLLFGFGVDVNDALYQISGEALRMQASQFAEEIAKPGPFRSVLQKYAQAFYAQMSQTTACNQLHSAEQRLARWLLMSQDRVGRPRFDLTQEFMAQMLGVRRSTVSLVASALQKAGLIAYTRGILDVLDRPGLEAASCECYAAVRKQYRWLLS